VHNFAEPRNHGKLCHEYHSQRDYHSTISEPAAITVADRLRPDVSPKARSLLTHGTGAMERNIETVIARRFTRWGMR